MSKYANENTLEYINTLKSENKGCYESPIYKAFFSIFWEMMDSDQDKYKELYKLIYRYKAEKENREGIDLVFLALTGYTLGTLLGLAIDFVDEDEEDEESEL